MNARPLFVALFALAAIWGAVAGVMALTAKHTSTPEKVQALMAAAPWLENDRIDEAARRKYLDDLIAHVNRLDFQQRRESRENDPEVGERFMESLSMEERHRFIEETVEHHFKSVMKAFNEMSREERQRIVAQARRNMEKDNRDDRNMERLREEDEQVYEHVVEKGLGAYYEDASAETKMDLAPLMEEMQQRMRGFGGRR